MGTKAVRISEENINLIKSLGKDGEAFDDTLSRVIGRGTQNRVRQLNTMKDLKDWVERILCEYKKLTFREVFKVIKNDKDYPKYLAKYPQINSKTNNGQTRLAHFIKTNLNKQI